MPPRPCIGELRHRIQVARRSRAPDPDFGYQEVMTLVAEVWADIGHANTGVNYLDDATDAEAPGVTHVFTVRRDRRVTLPDARTYVVHGGRRHKVLRVREEDQTGRFLALLCAVQEIDPNDPSAPGWILTTEGGEQLVAYP